MDWESTCNTELQLAGDRGVADCNQLAIAAGPGVGSALVFVDADNQSPALAKPLLQFLSGIRHTTARIFIAGNGSGDRVSGWQAVLRDINPSAHVTTHVAPMRKQSADVRLMFELATLYHAQPDSRILVLIVSRDDLLLAAAESLSALGHHVLLTVGSSTPATPLTTELPVVVLPLLQAVTQAAPKEAAPPTAEPKQSPATSDVDAQIVNAAVAKIRQSLSQSKGGGYAASAVGQVLSQMGHDKAMRTRIVRAIPNLRETGVGPDKRLIF